MFARELQSRQRKLETEALERHRAEKRKEEALLQQRQAARQRRQEAERLLRQRQLEAERRREEEESRKEQLRETNRGVFLEASLTPSPLSKETALSQGIKRWMDKVVLPGSMSDALMQQEAHRNGALLFELKAENGTRTHVGVLQFSAPEGTVMVPSHVWRRLWEGDGECEGKVQVSYRRLENGSLARLQPLKHGFHEAVGAEMKEILETALSQYSVLTEGDVIEIPLSGAEQTHHLKVVELEPARAVRILQTDLEVDVLPSAEVQEQLREKLQKSNQAPFGFGSNRLSQHRIAKRPQPQSDTPPVQSEPSASGVRSTQEAELSPEAADDSEDVITCSVRFPDGSSVQRRFKLDDALSNLFRFINIKGSHNLTGRSYSLVTQYPRSVLSEETHATDTFRQHDFEKRQAFFVETL